jgi:hypothetical protein
MKRSYQRAIVAVVAALAVPGIFSVITISRRTIDSFQDRREVARFIEDHKALVAERLKDPKVYSFSLAPDPHDLGTLLIQFDVEDKLTYETLESDLVHDYTMRFPPAWKTTMRSNEKLEKNWGLAAWGIGLVTEASRRFLIDAVASLAAAGIFLFFALRRLR